MSLTECLIKTVWLSLCGIILNVNWLLILRVVANSASGWVRGCLNPSQKIPLEGRANGAHLWKPIIYMLLVFNCSHLVFGIYDVISRRNVYVKHLVYSNSLVNVNAFSDKTNKILFPNWPICEKEITEKIKCKKILGK